MSPGFYPNFPFDTLLQWTWSNHHKSCQSLSFWRNFSIVIQTSSCPASSQKTIFIHWWSQQLSSNFKPISSLHFSPAKPLLQWKSTFLFNFPKMLFLLVLFLFQKGISKKQFWSNAVSRRELKHNDACLRPETFFALMWNMHVDKMQLYLIDRNCHWKLAIENSVEKSEPTQTYTKRQNMQLSDMHIALYGRTPLHEQVSK